MVNLDDLILPLEAEASHPPTPAPGRTPPVPWPTNLPLELALGADPQDQILARNGVTDDDFARWALSPAFRRALAEAARDVREQGLTFKMVCQGIASDFLQELDSCMHDPSIGFATRLDAFKTVTKLAGLEPKDQKEVGGQNANLVQININL